MLLDSVQRMDSKGVVRKVCIDTLRQTHPGLFKQLKAVPALMILPSREILYGKQVFDYLLLPSRGKLVVGDGGATGAVGGNGDMNGGSGGASASMSGVLHQEEGILPFGGLKGGFGDNFAGLDESESTPSNPDCNPHSSYNWTSIAEMEKQGRGDGGNIAAPIAGGMGVETKVSKGDLNLDEYKQRREQDKLAFYSAQPMPTI